MAGYHVIENKRYVPFVTTCILNTDQKIVSARARNLRLNLIKIRSFDPLLIDHY